MTYNVNDEIKKLMNDPFFRSVVVVEGTGVSGGIPDPYGDEPVASTAKVAGRDWFLAALRSKVDLIKSRCGDATTVPIGNLDYLANGSWLPDTGVSEPMISVALVLELLADRANNPPPYILSDGGQVAWKMGNKDCCEALRNSISELGPVL